MWINLKLRDELCLEQDVVAGAVKPGPGMCILYVVAAGPSCGITSDCQALPDMISRVSSRNAAVVQSKKTIDMSRNDKVTSLCDAESMTDVIRRT